MKKMIVGTLVGLMLLAGCSSSMTIDGVEYKPYGLINQENVKAPGIKYEPCWGNIVWGALLIETVIGPIYFYGMDMFEPVGKK